MFIRIEISSGVPITRQIMDQIRTQCASGVLAPHDRLPSVRELARELAVNQNTILRVYERLTTEGLLDRRHGDGTYVAAQPPAHQLDAQRELLDAELQRLIRRAVALNVSKDDLCQMLRRGYEANNPHASVPLDSIPPKGVPSQASRAVPGPGDHRLEDEPARQDSHDTQANPDPQSEKGTPE